MPDNETNRRVSIGYTMAASKAFKTSFSSQQGTADDKTKFRFIYLSGAAAERDQEKPLWLFRDNRRIRVFIFNLNIQLLSSTDTDGQKVSKANSP